MPTPFNDFKLKEAQDAVNGRYGEDAAKNIAYINGDHFQDGDGWIGPRRADDDALFDASMEEIKRTFISQNALGEMTATHVSGVLGREPHWKLPVKRPLEPVKETDPLTGEEVEKPGQPDEREVALIAEAEAAMVEWWNKRNVLEILKTALEGALTIRRAPLRLYIPPGLLSPDGTLPSVDLAGALDLIYIQHLGYDDDKLQQIVPSATVWVDKRTRFEAGIFTYNEDKEDRAELSYVDDLGNTVLRIINGGGDIGQPIAMNLGRRLLMYEMKRKPIVTPQTVSQQKALNQSMTMKVRNDVQGGYLERILLNVKWPGKTIVKPDGSTEFIPEVMHTGPGTTNSFQAQVYTDENGVTQVLNPQVQFRDPVQATTFIESGNHTRLGLLQEGKQAHTALASEAALSGESRRESRASYATDLQISGGMIEATARWILETVLAMASFIAGAPGRYEELRAYVEAKIDSGPVSPDDMRAAAEMWDRGVWDWETTVGKTGIDDVDAVKQRLAQERAEGNMRALAERDAFEQDEDQPDNNEQE